MKILALDLSTAAAGWALFDAKTKKLLTYGVVKPQVKGITAMTYPRGQLMKMRSITEQIKAIIESNPDLTRIAIEEVNRGIARLTQKTLDGLHFIFVDRCESYIPIMVYRDSDGKVGWRKVLNFVLSDNDKRLNTERKKLNVQYKKLRKKMKRGEGPSDLPIINKKHLACRFVNKTYGLNLDCDANETDGDIADAIGLGHVVVNGL